MTFDDRSDAGRRLGQMLTHLRGADVVVVGLPRGGIPVAYEVARALDAPLDAIVVRKVGVPFQPELGMGAIAEGGVRIVNDEVVRLAGVSPQEFAAVEARERAELDRRAKLFRGDAHQVPLEGRTVVVVDDGLATGSTASAACQVVRLQGAARVVLAVPVAPPQTLGKLARDADEVVCLEMPEWFFAIGVHYADFSQTSDDEVRDLLERAATESAARSSAAGPAAPRAAALPPAALPPAAAQPAATEALDPPPYRRDVEISANDIRLHGQLTVPEEASGVVAFAHGSGSSRHSPRNRFVAAALEQAGLATLLFDLLTPEEEHDRANVFDIELLASRLLAATRWLAGEPRTADLPTGYFGASTGAAAALWAAAEPGAEIGAVVSRGGRPDLAGSKLGAVRAPTLLIVGGYDHLVLDLNAQAQAKLTGENRLEVIPEATHLFAEPGTLEQVATLARDWFLDHLTAPPAI
jgi:putative phosphoribosyl transferase